MKRARILGAVLAVGGVLVAAGAARGQQDKPNVATIQKVNDSLYVILGGGGNTAAFLTDKGVVLVDTKLANWGQAILDKVRTITDKPVTTIINTHTHADHVGSNEFFPASVEIVVHENTKANMEKMDAVKTKPHAMPDRTYKDRLSLMSGKDQIDLYYFGRAHTSGDTFVVFPQLRTMHAGDVFPGKQLPFMDAANGGSGVAYPETLAKATAGIKNVDTVITGHSTVMRWADLVEFTDFTRTFLDAVRTSMKAGKTIEQTAAEIKLPAKFVGYAMPASGFAAVPGAVKTIYGELGGK